MRLIPATTKTSADFRLNGSRDRMHLVIDAVVNDRGTTLFERVAGAASGRRPSPVRLGGWYPLSPRPIWQKGYPAGLLARSDGLLRPILIEPPDSKALRLQGF